MISRVGTACVHTCAARSRSGDGGDDSTPAYFDVRAPSGPSVSSRTAAEGSLLHRQFFYAGAVLAVSVLLGKVSVRASVRRIRWRAAPSVCSRNSVHHTRVAPLWVRGAWTTVHPLASPARERRERVSAFCSRIFHLVVHSSLPGCTLGRRRRPVENAGGLGGMQEPAVEHP